MPLAALGPILAGAVGTSAAATTAAWGAIAAGTMAGTNLVGAHMQGNAARDAARMQTGAADRAAEAQREGQREAQAFLERQAGYDANVAETNRHANYDQYVASRAKLNSVADLLGMPHEQIPGYVPLPSSPFAGGAAGARPVGSGATPPAAAARGGSAEDLRALIAGGMDPQQAVAQFNQRYGRTTGNEARYYDPSQHGGVATIGLPEAYLSLEPNGWQITPRGNSAPSGPYRAPSIEGVFGGSATPPYRPQPMTPALALPAYRPQSVAAYLGM